MKIIQNLSILILIGITMSMSVQAKTFCKQKHTFNCGIRYKKNIANKIVISGQFIGETVPKEVTLILWKDIISVDKRNFTDQRKFIVSVEGRKFKFNIDHVDKISYISLGWGSSFQDSNAYEYLNTYLASAGDNIHMDITEYRPENLNQISGVDSSFCANCKQFSFSGIGAQKYQCRYDLDLIKEKSKCIERLSDINTPGKETLSSSLNRRVEEVNCYKFDQIACLRKYRGKITPEILDLLKADVLSQASYRISWLVGFNLFRLDHIPNSERIKDKSLMQSYLKKISLWSKEIRPDILAQSAQYSKFLLNVLKVKRELSEEKESVQHVIKNNFSGILKERLIIANILDNAWHWEPNEFNKSISDAKILLKKKAYVNVLDSILHTTIKGSKVYDFSLIDSTGAKVSLSDFKGKVVFMDFWFVGCGGCSDYYNKVVSKTEEMFKDNADVVFVTMSIDRNRDKWVKGINSGEYTSKSAVNLYSNLGVSDPLVKKFNILSYPHPVLIDRNGRLFSNSNQELRGNGIHGLSDMINKALLIR